MADEDDDDRSFLERHRGIMIAVAVLAVGVFVYTVVQLLSGSHGGSSERMDTVSISMPPPPPPPPPKPIPTPPPLATPPPEQQQDQQKMVEQQPVQDEKKDAPKPKAPDAPAPLGTGITGPGGQDMGLAGGLGGGGGYGDGSGGGGGTKFGWYATEVQNAVSDALRNNPRTRRASMSLVVRIWPDSTGHVVKAHISGSTGDTTLDATLQNDILTSIQLTDPPPADMPLPIVMRISAQRPQ